MTTREAARPLRRYMRARVRAASLPPSYTITRDVTYRVDPAGVQFHRIDPPARPTSGNQHGNRSD
jgi:hypothetical protein